MDGRNGLSQSPEYKSFRSYVPLRKICVDEDPNKVWKLYDAGPRTVGCPLICLPPVTGTADTFFCQILSLTSRGIRVISVEYPPYWSVSEWCEGFRRLLDHLKIDCAHIFGASLGGFLAQKFVEYTYNCPRVASLLLCSSFVDTKIFRLTMSAPMFWLLPAAFLRKIITSRLPIHQREPRVVDSIDFMVEQLESLSQSDLASRLMLNCSEAYVQPHKVKVRVTIIDVFDNSSLPQSVKDEVCKCYPEARLAHLKTGGSFPYLSRADEVNLYIQIHLREFIDGRMSAFDHDTQV